MTRDDVRPLARERYPLLVTFGDIDDPASVKRVDPDDVDAALGLCPDGSGLRDEEAPWRALDLTWREWARWQASGLSLEDYRRRGMTNVAPALAARMDRDAPARRDTSADCHRLTSITLQITDEPVTEGRVEKLLGWLGEYRENHYRLNGERCVACPATSDHISDMLGSADFVLMGK